MTVKWHGERVMKMIEAKVMKGAAAGAEELRKLVVKNITQTSGRPSRPGEYPATQTGQLAGSIKVRRMKVGKKTVFSVVANAKYASFVEKMRPFLKRTARENRDHLREVIMKNSK